MGIAKRISSGNFKSFIKFSWWKIIVLFITLFGIATYISAQKTKYRSDEIIKIFATCKLENNHFSKKYYETFDPNGLVQKIELTAINFDNEYFKSAYESSFGIDTDLLIVSESFLKSDYKDMFEVSTYKFNDVELNKIEEEYHLDVYKYKDFNIGFKIFDIEDNNYFSESHLSNYFSFNENYYVFIDNTSINLKKIDEYNFSSAFNSLENLLKIN